MKPEITCFLPQYAPITFQGGFVSAPLEIVLSEYCTWLKDRSRGFDVQTSSANFHDVGSVFLSLQPVRDPWNRMLFVQTSEKWTALFCNGFRVADVSSSTAVLAARLRVSGIYYASCPSFRASAGGSSEQQGALKFAYYGRSSGASLTPERTVHLLQEDAKWRFSQQGVPMTWEDPTKYQSKAKVKRLSTDSIRKGLMAFSIRVDDETFFRRPCSIVTRQGLPASPGYSFAEARRLMGMNE
jgi:hypothetical protein